jgi:hypothetical protein
VTIRRSSGRPFVATITAATLALGGVIAASAPALAEPSWTTVWYGARDQAPRPAPTDRNGTISVETPSTLLVEPGQVVELAVEMSCMNPSSEDYFGWRLDNVDDNLSFNPGTWSDTSPAIMTGSLTLTMNENLEDRRLALGIYAGGDCWGAADEANLSEDFFTFTFDAPEGPDPDPGTEDPEPTSCPSLPGVKLNEQDDTDRFTYAQDDSFATFWDLDDNGVLDEFEGYTEDADLQDGGWNGFVDDVRVGGSGIDWEYDCATRDGSTDWLADDDVLTDLEVTGRMTYYSADLARSVITIENTGDTAMTEVPVATTSYYDYDVEDIRRSEQQIYGEVTWQRGDAYQPVVAHAWGGPTTAITDVSRFVEGEVAPSQAEAVEAAEAWLAIADDISSDYFADLEGDVLNWGPGALTPQVSYLPKSDPEDEFGNTEIDVDVVIPSLAAGETVHLVQFTRVSYSAPLEWVDESVADATVSSLYADAVVASAVGTGWDYAVEWGSLPEGLILDEDGTISGTPEGEPGYYEFEVLATDDDGFEMYAYVTMRLGPFVWVDDSVVGGTIGSEYSDSIEGPAFGESYTYFLAEGDELPAGLTLHDDGTITGELEGPASSTTVTVIAYDGYYGYEYSTDITINVSAAGTAPVWVDTEFEQLYKGLPADAEVVALGVNVTYEVVDGLLPAGIVLNEDGTFTGEPLYDGPFTFTVRASNKYGHIEHVVSGVVKPAELGLALQFKAGTRVEDATTTATAAGLEPGSEWTLTLFSSPRLIASGVVAPSGVLDQLVRIPADTEPGVHRLLLSGVAPDGTTLTSEAWFTLGRDGIILAVSLDGPTPGLEQLAYTGSIAPVSGGVAAVLALVLGGVMLVLRRRGQLG